MSDEQMDTCRVCGRELPLADMPGLLNYQPPTWSDPGGHDGPVCEDCCDKEEARIEGAREAAIEARMEQMIEDRIRRDRR